MSLDITIKLSNDIQKNKQRKKLAEDSIKALFSVKGNASSGYAVQGVTDINRVTRPLVKLGEKFSVKSCAAARDDNGKINKWVFTLQ